MGTLIQSYGPIYGEVVNGTVQGRPNGSVYVPISNTIRLLGGSQYIQNYLVGGNNRVRFCDESSNPLYFGYDCLSQDLASNVRAAVFSDDELTTLLSYQSFTAGDFNEDSIANILRNYTLDPDATYYIVVQLMNNAVPVATSEVRECTVVTP